MNEFELPRLVWTAGATMALLFTIIDVDILSILMLLFMLLMAVASWYCYYDEERKNDPTQRYLEWHDDNASK